MANSGGGSGVGLFTLLGVLFIGLKLTGFIDWSWIWVTCPLWGGFALVIFIIAIYAIIVTMKPKRPSRRLRL